MNSDVTQKIGRVPSIEAKMPSLQFVLARHHR